MNKTRITVIGIMTVTNLNASDGMEEGLHNGWANPIQNNNNVVAAQVDFSTMNMATIRDLNTIVREIYQLLPQDIPIERKFDLEQLARIIPIDGENLIKYYQLRRGHFTDERLVLEHDSFMNGEINSDTGLWKKKLCEYLKVIDDLDLDERIALNHKIDRLKELGRSLKFMPQ